MKTFRLISCLCIFGLLQCSSAFAADEAVFEGRHRAAHGSGPMIKMLKELNLTEGQRQALKELHRKNREGGRVPPPKKVGDRLKKINGLVLDGAAEQEISAEVELLKSDYIEMSRTAAEFRSILTPEQREQMKEIRARRSEKWEQRKMNFGQKLRKQIRGEGVPDELTRQGKGR